MGWTERETAAAFLDGGNPGAAFLVDPSFRSVTGSRGLSCERITGCWRRGAVRAPMLRISCASLVSGAAAGWHGRPPSRHGRCAAGWRNGRRATRRAGDACAREARARREPVGACLREAHARFAIRTEAQSRAGRRAPATLAAKKHDPTLPPSLQSSAVSFGTLLPLHALWDFCKEVAISASREDAGTRRFHRRWPRRIPASAARRERRAIRAGIAARRRRN